MSIIFYSCILVLFFIFFFNDTATTEIYTLSLHDALPISTALTIRNCETCICISRGAPCQALTTISCSRGSTRSSGRPPTSRSEEHTSELQSRQYLVCRLLLEKKK